MIVRPAAVRRTGKLGETSRSHQNDAYRRAEHRYLFDNLLFCAV